jgi:hypothetical protein
MIIKRKEKITGCGGTHLSSQLCGKCKYEDNGPGQPGLKCETLLEK